MNTAIAVWVLFSLAFANAYVFEGGNPFEDITKHTEFGPAPPAHKGEQGTELDSLAELQALSDVQSDAIPSHIEHVAPVGHSTRHNLFDMGSFAPSQRSFHPPVHHVRLSDFEGQLAGVEGGTVNLLDMTEGTYEHIQRPSTVSKKNKKVANSRNSKKAVSKNKTKNISKATSRHLLETETDSDAETRHPHRHRHHKKRSSHRFSEETKIGTQGNAVLASTAVGTVVSVTTTGTSASQPIPIYGSNVDANGGVYINPDNPYIRVPVESTPTSASLYASQPPRPTRTFIPRRPLIYPPPPRRGRSPFASSPLLESVYSDAARAEATTPVDEMGNIVKTPMATPATTLSTEGTVGSPQQFSPLLPMPTLLSAVMEASRTPSSQFRFVPPQPPYTFSNLPTPRVVVPPLSPPSLPAVPPVPFVAALEEKAQARNSENEDDEDNEYDDDDEDENVAGDDDDEDDEDDSDEEGDDHDDNQDAPVSREHEDEEDLAESRFSKEGETYDDDDEDNDDDSDEEEEEEDEEHSEEADENEPAFIQGQAVKKNSHHKKKSSSTHHHSSVRHRAPSSTTSADGDIPSEMRFSRIKTSSQAKVRTHSKAKSKSKVAHHLRARTHVHAKVADGSHLDSLQLPTLDAVPIEQLQDNTGLSKQRDGLLDVMALRSKRIQTLQQYIDPAELQVTHMQQQFMQWISDEKNKAINHINEQAMKLTLLKTELSQLTALQLADQKQVEGLDKALKVQTTQERYNLAASEFDYIQREFNTSQAFKLQFENQLRLLQGFSSSAVANVTTSPATGGSSTGGVPPPATDAAPAADTTVPSVDTATPEFRQEETSEKTSAKEDVPIHSHTPSSHSKDKRKHASSTEEEEQEAAAVNENGVHYATNDVEWADGEPTESPASSGWKIRGAHVEEEDNGSNNEEENLHSRFREKQHARSEEDIDAMVTKTQENENEHIHAREHARAHAHAKHHTSSSSSHKKKIAHTTHKHEGLKKKDSPPPATTPPVTPPPTTSTPPPEMPPSIPVPIITPDATVSSPTAKTAPPNPVTSPSAITSDDILKQLGSLPDFPSANSPAASSTPLTPTSSPSPTTTSPTTPAFSIDTPSFTSLSMPSLPSLPSAAAANYDPEFMSSAPLTTPTDAIAPLLTLRSADGGGGAFPASPLDGNTPFMPPSLDLPPPPSAAPFDDTYSAFLLQKQHVSPSTSPQNPQFNSLYSSLPPPPSRRLVSPIRQRFAQGSAHSPPLSEPIYPVPPSNFIGSRTRAKSSPHAAPHTSRPAIGERLRSRLRHK